MKTERQNQKVVTIIVENCFECGKDNWQHFLYEIKFENRRETVWLCPNCVGKLVKMLEELIK